MQASYCSSDALHCPVISRPTPTPKQSKVIYLHNKGTKPLSLSLTMQVPAHHTTPLLLSSLPAVCSTVYTHVRTLQSSLRSISISIPPGVRSAFCQPRVSAVVLIAASQEQEQPPRRLPSLWMLPTQPVAEASPPTLPPGNRRPRPRRPAWPQLRRCRQCLLRTEQ